MPEGLAARLLRWFSHSRRDLPWRRTRDPYPVWISEIMLQQTRAAAVVPYFEKFLRLFPDVAALARARQADLLRCWSGLGYYSRARNLRLAARQIVAERGGVLPRTSKDWLELPGIGPYTAAAVASIAFGERVAVLDGNVARVMARLTAHRGDIRSPQVREELRQQAQRILDRRRPGAFNEALMELGATVCLPRHPRCAVCPAAGCCEAYRLGLQQELPVKMGRRAPERIEMGVAVARRDGRLLLRRRPADASLMPGFWELPETAGLRLGRPLGRFRHSITHHQYTVTVREASLRGARPSGCEWIALSGLARLPLTTVTRKALAVTGSRGATAGRSRSQKPN